MSTGSGGRASLARLVQQIAEIVGQGEDSSGSQQSDGSLRGRLQGVVLSILDQVVSSAAPNSKEVGSVLKLLNLVLAKVPNMLAGDNHGVLSEVLERIVPILGRADLADVHGELADAITNLLALLASVSPAGFTGMATGLHHLLQDACGVAAVLSSQPGVSAVVTCFPGALRGEDSAEPPLEVAVASQASCELLLTAVLHVLAGIAQLRQLALVPGLAAALVPSCCVLLLSNSLALQVAAMQCLAAVVLAAAPRTVNLLHLLDTLELACQRSPGRVALAAPVQRQKWQQALLALLQAVLEAAGGSPAGRLATPRATALAAALAQTPGAAPPERLLACQLVLSAVLQQPALLEVHCCGLLHLLRSCDGGCRQVLLQMVAFYLQQHPEEQVHAAVASALQRRGAAVQAAVPQRCEAAEAGTSARKRRRLGLTPQQPGAAPAAEASADRGMTSLVPADGDGLDAVAAALATLAPELPGQPPPQQQEWEEQLAWTRDPGMLTGLACLVTILTAADPPQAAALAAATLPCQLVRGTISAPGAVASPMMAAELRLLLAGLQAMLRHGQDKDWTALRKPAIPVLVRQLLELAGRQGPDPEGHGSAAQDCRELALCAGLAAAQAELLDATHALLDMLGQALARQSLPAKHTAAALLPAACVIMGAKEQAAALHQPRASQGHGRRQRHQAAAPTQAPNPAAQLLQQALSSQAADEAAMHALVQGLVLALRHAHEPAHLVTAAVHGALGGPLLAETVALGSPRPALCPAVSEWAHAALEQLCATDLTSSRSQVALVAAVGSFLQHGALGTMEHSRGLAEWLLAQCSSKCSAARAELLRSAALLTEPQVVLALYHEGPHPIHSKDREVAVERHEVEVLKALKAQLEAPGASGAVREGLLQAIAVVGNRLRGAPAHLLMLAILVLQLDAREAVLRAAAGEALVQLADARRCSLWDLLFVAPRLVELVGCNLASKPDLLPDLAELLETSPRKLALAILPHALPAVVAGGAQAALAALAEQAGLEPQRMLVDYGHHVVAKQLFDGSENFDAFIAMAEAITGQDFVVFVRRIMPNTITEVILLAGGAAAGGGGAGPAAPGAVGLPGAPPAGAGGVAPPVVKRAADMLHELSRILSGDGSGLLPDEFLAGGDHVTRMLKNFGDRLDRHLPASAAAHVSPADASEVLAVLRCVSLLIHLTGRFVGRFLPQMMVLLTAALRAHNAREVKLQGLEGWLLLETTLQRHAPVQMSGVVNQVVVALLQPLQEGGPVCAAALAVLRRLVKFCREAFPEKLRSLPPLPNWIPEVEEVHAEVQAARGTLTTREHVELLLESVGDESMAVRANALRELCTVLSNSRDWVMRLLSAGCSGGAGGGRDSGAESADASLVSRLISALLRCCEPDAGNFASRQAQQACAECLGLLGAVDPSRVNVDLTPVALMCSSDEELAAALITKHLVRVLKTAATLQALDAATVSIQDILRHYNTTTQEGPTGQGGASHGAGTSRRSRETTPGGGNPFFNSLPKEVRAIVRPYLGSKYSTRSQKRSQGVVFRSQPHQSFRRWLALWMQQLVDNHARGGERLWLFQAVIPVLRYDIATALFVLPYLVQHVVFHGTDQERSGIFRELEAVLEGGPSSREGTLCLQAVFSMLDVLQRWSEDAKVAAMRGKVRGERVATDTGRPAIEADARWSALLRLLGSIPRQALAQAASQCGAHARALQYYETHVRDKHGGGLNPAALRSAQYEDDEVSFLQEVYGRLEEPDGLQGLVKLRAGGPRPQDQRLAAEKAGNWSEALTIYEQALQHAGGGSASTSGAGAAAAALLQGGTSGGGAAAATGLSATQRGYLSCLLHMGHLQGVLAQVEGLAAAGGGAAGSAMAAQLAAMGTAAAWRLGRWGLLEGYVAAAGGAGAPRLDPDAMWEVRLGRLLSAVAGRDDEALRAELEAARTEVMGPFSAAAMESYDRAYPHLVKLHMLQEIADAAAAAARRAGPAERRRALRLEERLALTQSSLATQEPILALRRQLAALSGAGAEVGAGWLQYAKLCRATGHHDAATTAVLEAGSCQVPTAGLEQVLLLWDKGQPYRAVAELQQLDRALTAAAPAAPGRGGRDEHSRYHAQVVLQLAQWMAETGQGARDEITGLFERAVGMESRWETGLFRYAVYLDEVMTDAKQRQEDKSAGGGDKSARPGLDRLAGRSRIKLGEDRPYTEYLPEVIKNYGQSVVHGHAHIYQSLPRMLTIWFDFGTRQAQLAAASGGGIPTKEKATFAAVGSLIGQLAKSVPMHAWLTALPQLISRMCHPQKDVAEQVKAIITQVAQVYPQQAAWLLSGVRCSGNRPRRDAANAVISKARKGAGAEVVKLFGEAQVASEQWNKLAFLQPSTTRPLSARKEMSTLCRGMPLALCMPTMAALTVNLPPGGTVEKGWTAFSDELVSIAEVVDEVEVMHSLQRPKKITLVGSDGHQYVFLAKPKDDLRKDNRLMEVAGILNKLFDSDPQARRRNLYLRRFAVIPLQDEAGIVEWVPNTRGIRHCLQDTYTAEGMFDPKHTNMTIKRMYESFTGRRRAELLDQVLEMFPPKFHRWQLGKFPEPAAWLNARLAFTHTAGVWSMVGHICGLGDRHGENILLDESSGDVVEVDFSCLFDKGLTLDKPEMVPFRLTQNMIDGFGVSGHEGAFRRTCEITLDVLRRHRGTILSIMDTFVNDPLVEWTRAGRVNDEGCENPHARDALATVEGRLRGSLLGVSSQPCMPLSVEGHAHRLIAEAADKENLGLMYIWWMPWF